MSEISPRWLNPEQAAQYVGRRVDELPRLVKAGKMPKPSYHFGPRSARYDRDALDAMFTGASASVVIRSIDQAEQEAVNAIIRRARENRQKAPGRRVG